MNRSAQARIFSSERRSTGHREFHTALNPAFERARTTYPIQRVPSRLGRVGGPDTRGSQDRIDGRAPNRGARRGPRLSSRDPRAPRSVFGPGRAAERGSTGAKAHSKVERLAVKVEGTDSVSHDIALRSYPFCSLRSARSRSFSLVLARYAVGTVATRIREARARINGI